MKRTLLAIGFVFVVSTPAGAADGDHRGIFAHVIQRIGVRLAAATTARRPALKPPKPVRVTWRARRVSSVDLHAPLLELVAADLDGDGKAELIALTTREVVVLKRRRRRKIIVLTRALLSGTPATIRPRLPVGALSVGDTDGDGVIEVYVRVSERADGASYAWQNNKLEPTGRVVGFPVCLGASAELRPGRHVYLGTSLTWPAGYPSPKVPKSFFSVRCAAGLVDPTGRSLGALGLLDTSGGLAVHTWGVCAADAATCRRGVSFKRDVRFVGTAFVIADIDRDGRPEVISAASRARGDADRVSVYSARRSRMRRVYKRSFSGGIVGVAAGDMDGDGDTEAIVAVRLLGSSRIDLWVLN